MKNNLKHKLYMGFRGFMMRIPPMLSEKGSRKGERGAKANSDSLSKEERRVHHFIVMKMAIVKDPITAELIADELGMPIDTVYEIINKLENLKTFIYRSDGKRINWAYPLSLDNTGFRMTASTGEQFFAAWGADAFATPYVYGKLKKKKLSFTIQAECANSGRQIEIELDSELNIKNVTDGSNPMFCLPIVPIVNSKEPSIVDIFWRKSLLFWSEEDVREYKKKERDLRVYMNLSKRALAGVKRMQSSIFGFDEI
jgi:hypothetical protein